MVGGIILAMVISLINVTCGIICGLIGSRLIGHISVVQKFIEALVLVVFTIIALVWNTTVAIYRDLVERFLASQSAAEFAAGATSDEPPQTTEHIGTLFGTAFQQLIDLRLSLSSIESIGLLFLGLLIWFLSALKGRSGFTDPYWGYKPVDQAFRKADDEWNDARDEYDDEVAAIVESEIEELTHAAKDDQVRLTDVFKITNTLRVREREALGLVESWDTEQKQLLKYYRDENLKVRGTEQSVPAYFDSYPSVLEGDEIESLESRLMDLENGAKTTVEQNDTARQMMIAAIHRRRSEHASTRDQEIQRVIDAAERRTQLESPLPSLTRAAVSPRAIADERGTSSANEISKTKIPSIVTIFECCQRSLGRDCDFDRHGGCRLCRFFLDPTPTRGNRSDIG